MNNAVLRHKMACAKYYVPALGISEDNGLYTPKYYRMYGSGKTEVINLSHRLDEYDLFRYLDSVVLDKGVSVMALVRAISK